MQFREAVEPQYDAKPNKQAYRDINTTVCFTPLFVDMPARNAAQSGSTVLAELPLYLIRTRGVFMHQVA
jgi:hypothetical protein